MRPRRPCQRMQAGMMQDRACPRHLRQLVQWAIQLTQRGTQDGGGDDVAQQGDVLAVHSAARMQPCIRTVNRETPETLM